MALGIEEYRKLEQVLINRISNDLSIANRTNSIEEYLKSIKCDDLLFPYNKMYTNNAKIVIIGKSLISIKEIESLAKELGINPKRLELYLDYEKNTNLNISFLKNNVNYSDIIFGPVPHKMEGIGDYNSAIAMIKHNSKDFPKLNLASDSNSLKITKNTLRKCLMNTQYYLDNNVSYC